MALDLFGARVTGTSPVHRARPGVKLAVLAASMVVVLGFRTPYVEAGAAVVVAVLAAVARVPVRMLARQLRPALAFALTAGALAGWSAGPAKGPVQGATVAASLVVAVAAAALVTLTTPTQGLLDAFVTALRPLRSLGIDPDRVGLTLALAISSVPVVARLAGEVRQARMARGAERSVRAFAVPLMIRTVRHADRLGEALRARGVDD